MQMANTNYGFEKFFVNLIKPFFDIRFYEGLIINYNTK